MEDTTWFKLFASCRIVKGKYGSAIYDLERNEIYELPNELASLLEQLESRPVNAIGSTFGEEQVPQVRAFMNKFIDKELAFFTDEPALFPDIDLTWDQPYFITNAILEIDNPARYDLVAAIGQLNKLLCQALQIRILFAPDKEMLISLLHAALLNTQLISVELLAPYDTGLTVDEWDELMLKEPRIRKVLLYGGPADEILINEGDRFGRKLISFQKDIRKDANEKISRDRFVPNLSSFTEALVFNAGLNRKVTIDKDGEIRNYLTHAVSYGNINTQSLAAVIQTSAFREKWSLSNDKIEHCKDCKYRYVCVSNSDILEIDGKYYKKEMCTFNQLENTWGQ